MNPFVHLFHRIEQSQQSNFQINAIKEYLAVAHPNDAIWAIFLLNGHKPKRCVNTQKLVIWALEFSALPDWLYRECHLVIGDTAETLARILPPSKSTSNQSLSDWMHFVLRLKSAEEEEIKESVLLAWMELDFSERYLLNKWMTASNSIKVDRRLFIQALSDVYGQSEAEIAYRLSMRWSPLEISLDRLFKQAFPEAVLSNYPPFKEYPILQPSIRNSLSVQDLEFRAVGQGIRVQMIVCEGKSFLWSENGDFLSPIFPEFDSFSSRLPFSFSIEGELIVQGEEILEKSALERRILLKKSNKAAQRDCPVVLQIYDLVEWEGEAVSDWPEIKKREQLRKYLATAELPSTEWIEPKRFETWSQATEYQAYAQSLHSTGLRIQSISASGKREELGVWLNPNYSISAILSYAVKNRFGQFTEFSFSVWDEGVLVPIGKGQLNLAKEEMKAIDLFVKDNIQERFGPVRSIVPKLVFELKFSKILSSTRHKSGLVLHEIRIDRWLIEKEPSQASSLKELQDLIEFIAS